MAKRRSIEIDGFKHSNPIPGASIVGNLMMSSIIAGRDPKTGKLPDSLDGQLACLFGHVRAFVGAPAQFEDAASGAANATLAAWLAERGALPDLPGGFYRVSQGREVGHDAIIELGIDGAGDVWSGGRAVAVVTGDLDWPAS